MKKTFFTKLLNRFGLFTGSQYGELYEQCECQKVKIGYLTFQRDNYIQKLMDNGLWGVKK